MIDTLKLSRSLETRGVRREEAEAIADGLADAMRGDVGGRFDKLDQRLDRIDQRFDRVDQRASKVEADIADLKSDMKLMKWMVGFNLALTTGVLAKLLVG